MALRWIFSYRNLPNGGVLEISDRVYGKLPHVQYQYAIIIYMCSIDRFQDSMYAPLFWWLDAITPSSLIFYNFPPLGALKYFNNRGISGDLM